MVCCIAMNRPLRPSLLLLIGVAFSALAVPTFAEGPARLAADLAPGNVEAFQSPSGFARVGNRSVFLRNDNENYAPWVTDGTAQGTNPLGAFCPPCFTAELLGSTGSVAFYRASEPYETFNVRIWRTDGTPRGTFPVTGNLKLPQRVPDLPTLFLLSSINGQRLFFTGCTPELGCELWSSDGTPAGTAPVGEIVPGPGSANIRELAASGDRAFLIVTAADGSSPSLWFADAAAHTLVRLPETPQARLLVAGAGRAWFIAQDNGLEMWTSDGTAAGTRPLTSFSLPDPGIWFSKLIDGRLYFTAGDGILGTELWSLGDQPESLRRLTDFSKPAVTVHDIEKAGGRIVFLVNGAVKGTNLWSTRGDLRSTSPLAGCAGGCPAAASSLVGLGDGRFVFYGYEGRRRNGFWVTDGTAGGTRLLERSNSREHVQWAAAGGRVLFEITDEYSAGELWITDGSEAGTFFALEGGPYWSHYYGFANPLKAGAAGGSLLFSARTGESLIEVLWSSDGSPAGTRPLHQAVAAKSSNPHGLLGFRDGLLLQSCVDNVWELRFLRGAESARLLSQPSDYCATSGPPPIEAGGLAYFLPYQNGDALWRTDGTAAGTTAIVPAAGDDQPGEATAFGGQAAYWLVLPGPNNSLQSQLWRTDGSQAGTRKLVDLPLNVEAYKLTGIGDKLYFFDEEWQGGSFVSRPWVSDGTSAGTFPLTAADLIAPDVPYDQLSFVFVAFGGRVFFPLAGGTGSVEIWSTDGTPAGTVRAITAASGVRDPKALAVVDGRLYFAARRVDDASGRLLPWVSDGTDAGTVPLADVELGADSFAPLGLDRPAFVQFGDRVYFAASDPVHGEELWATDGTPAGTALVRDIAPGFLGSYPRSLVVWHGQLYFRARDRLHGMELWASDGSGQGTRLVQDIAAGASWSLPGELTPTEEGLYFSAHDGVHGRELWVLENEP